MTRLIHSPILRFCTTNPASPAGHIPPVNEKCGTRVAHVVGAVAQKCKDPLLLNDILRLLAACPKNLLGLRDRALILTGFAGAFRRSELCAMRYLT